MTHDQGEALSLADRVAVMDAGRIVQVDTPAGLYADPVDVRVAAFVGGAGLLPATVRGAMATCVLGDVVVAYGHQPRPDGTAVTLLVRPEQIRLVAAETSGACAVVDEVRFYGPYATVRLTVDGGPQPWRGCPPRASRPWARGSVCRSSAPPGRTHEHDLARGARGRPTAVPAHGVR